jgi:hypothetical protein
VVHAALILPVICITTASMLRWTEHRAAMPVGQISLVDFDWSRSRQRCFSLAKHHHEKQNLP